MSGELVEFYNDLATDNLRVIRPSNFIFLCGGPVANPGAGSAGCLRDYVIRVRRLDKEYPIILAEKATQLYRDTKYEDLITFEEDIARIAAMVLVIAESPGALAELGAFASSATIRPHLRVLLQDRFEADESFIRFGPVQRMKNDRDDNVGFFPWRVTKDGRLVTASAKPHYNEIRKFIASHMDKVPASMAFSAQREIQLIYIAYWIIYVAPAVSPGQIYHLVTEILPTARQDDSKHPPSTAEYRLPHFSAIVRPSAA